MTSMIVNFQRQLVLVSILFTSVLDLDYKSLKKVRENESLWDYKIVSDYEAMMNTLFTILLQFKICENVPKIIIE